MAASLVVQTSFIGDAVLTTPLIAELAKRGPVDVLVTPNGAAVLANNPSIRNIYKYDKRNSYAAAIHMWRTIRDIRGSGPYEAVYLAQGSVRSAIFALMTECRERIGFATSSGRALYTTRVEYRSDRHHAERLWWLSMSDCADPPLPQQLRVRLYPSDDDRAAIDDMLRQAGIADGTFIAIAPGSIWGTKRWPYYAELAKQLSSTHPIVIVGSERDRPIALDIMGSVTAGTAINACGTLSLLGSAELIGRAAALVTNDSAPQHLASAMGTPTLTIFGPTVPDFGFGPLAPKRATASVSDLSCRPCDRHGPQRCPLGHWRCMRELGTDDVMRLLNTILQPSAAA